MSDAADSAVTQPVDDRGATLVEVVVAIVLLGLVVAPVLTLLSLTVSASATERDHANAHAWLQIAADTLYGEERLDCGTEAASNAPAVLAAYEATVKDAPNPEGWDPSLINVIGLSFWDGEIYQATCYDDKNINLQLVTLQVANPDGEIIETVEVVKG